MISWTKTLKTISAAHASATAVPVFHYWRPVKDSPYIIWAEDGEGGDGGFQADGHKVQQSISGTTDLYTQKEYDEAIDEVQDMLDDVMTVWNLDSVMYEDETKLIHYSWTWAKVVED